jgi:hypothetical protein
MSAACRNCGAPVGEGDAFCGTCGSPTTGNEGTAPAATEATLAEALTLGDVKGDTDPPMFAPPPRAQIRLGSMPPDDALAHTSSPIRQMIDIQLGEPSYDPLSNRGFLGQIGRRLLLYVLLAVALELVLLFLDIIIPQSKAFDFTSVIVVVSEALIIVLGFSFLLIPVSSTLAYGSQRVSYQGHTAEQVIDRILKAFQRHAIPCYTLQVRPFSVPGETGRFYIQLRHGIFVGVITCFSHGRDLYVSWAFTLHMSPLRAIFMGAGRIILSVTGRSYISQTIRYDSARATPSAIQMCIEEAIEPAISGAGPGASESRSDIIARKGSQLPREISVMVYLDTDDAAATARAVVAVDHLVETIGYDGPIRSQVEVGSFVRHSWAKLKSALTSDEIKDLIIKTERALELRYVDSAQADFDNTIADAISKLSIATADIPSACVRAGSILFIKYPGPNGPVILIRNLSQREIRALELFPGIQQEPQTVLESLAIAIAGTTL